MRRATKAALISALIFPGCGHFYLKSKLRGAAFALFASGCMYVLISYAAKIANDISDRILSGDIPLDINSLMAEITSQLYGSADETQNIATFLLLGCWGIAIIDAFILGRKLAKPAKTG
jgi:hypothetical protein